MSQSAPTTPAVAALTSSSVNPLLTPSSTTTPNGTSSSPATPLVAAATPLATTTSPLVAPSTPLAATSSPLVTTRTPHLATASPHLATTTPHLATTAPHLATTTPHPTTPLVATASPLLATTSTPKSKDGLIRMLLQSATPTAVPSVTPPTTPRLMMPTLPSTPAMPGTGDDDNMNNYIHQIAGCEREVSLVMLDHSYAKPWNWKPDSTIVRPTKTLFVPRIPRNSFTAALTHSEEEIDVDGSVRVPTPPYDSNKASLMMNECERHVTFANPNLNEDISEWEEKVTKDGWTPAQNRLFTKVVKVFHADRLARLANEGSVNEPVQRRLTVDRTAKRMRQILSSVLWDTKLIQWLHCVLTDHLPRPYLAAYLDVLQTLRSKIPSLIDKMTSAKGVSGTNLTPLVKQGMDILLQRQWDPATSSISQQKMKKLPGNPTLIAVPSGSKWCPSPNRHRLWKSLLGQLGRFVEVQPDSTTDSSNEIGVYLHRLVNRVIAKIRDAKKGSHDRPVILVGWGVGAAVCCQVAAMESVTACICLGFPMFTLDGIRGESDDPILELKTPVLFVVGQGASQTRSDDVEDMRERMKGETGLVVVGGADDNLRVGKKKKKVEGITQSMVDRCIVDEIRDFLSACLTTPPPTFAIPTFTSMSVVDVSNRKSVGKTNRKRGGTATGSPANKRVRSTSTSGKGSASTTPTTIRILPPSESGEGQIEARKLLDMSQGEPQQQPQQQQQQQPEIKQEPAEAGATSAGDSAQLMASSPLLSSALTSPSSQTAPSSLAITNTYSASAKRGSSKPIRGRPRTAMPTLSSMLTTPISATPISVTPSTPIPPTLPTTPVSLPSLPSNLIRGVANRGGPRGMATPARAFAPRMVVPGKLVTTPTGSKIVPANQQNLMLVNTPPPPVSPVTGSLLQVTSAPTSTTKSPPTPKPRFTIPSAKPITVKRSVGVASTSGGGVTSKDNLYIVALPPDQIKNFDTRNIVQYQNQMVTLVSSTEDKPPAAAATPPVVEEKKEVKFLVAEKEETTPPRATPPATSDTPPAPKDSQTDRRNVAEILASLSGLMPEPPESDPPKPAGAAILSSSQSGSRIVRVLQTGSPRTTARTSVPVTSAATSAASSTSSSSRSRKQVFVMERKEDDKPMDDVPSEEAESATSSSSTTTADEGESLKPAVANPEVTYEPDILEEDLDDLEFKPYPKRGKGKGKGKAKGGKK